MRWYETVFEWGSDVWVALSFVPIAFFFIWALWRADRGDASTFKFIHFVTNDVGRGSYYALGYTALVVVCAWGTWALIATNRLTEWYLTIVIGGFVLGALGATASRTISKIKGAPDPDPAAGDAADKPPPALERVTDTRTTERVNVPQAPSPDVIGTGRDPEDKR